MNYKMYLGINNGEEGFILPVLPEKIELNENGDNKTYDIINLGEINTINKPKLMELSFESYFPLNYGPYASISSEKFFSPSFYISKIRQWREKKQKIRFIFVGSPLEINDLFTIENFKLNENGGEVGDIYYSIDLKRYKSYTAKRVLEVKNSTNNNKKVLKINSKTSRSDNKAKCKMYTVVHGDYLFYIAKKTLGNGNRWREIYNLNKNIIKDPNWIYPGQILKIP